MRFSIISVLSLVGAGMVAATPMEGALSSNVKRGDSSDAQVKQAAAALSDSKYSGETEVSECIAPLLCCTTLATPLDHIVDPILKDLGVDAAKIVGSIGLLCDPYTSSCTAEPQCCTEANLLGGTVALGCSTLKE